jgi:type IV pilus assembly protein PilC
MPIYKYVAKNLNGNARHGEIEGTDLEDAKRRLRQQKLVPLKLQILGNQSKVKKSRSSGFYLSETVGTKELQIFTRQFSTLISSGIPVVEALGVIAQGSTIPVLKKVLLSAQKSIEGGKGLGDSFAQFPGVFDGFYCNMIKAGESSGALDVILGRMSVYLEKNQKLRNQIRSAMMYPAMVILTSIVVVNLILIFIIPKFEEMYKQSNSELPQLTQMVIGLSKSLQDNWPLYVFSLVVGVFLFQIYRRTPQGKKNVEEVLMRLPVIGDIYVKSGVTRFAQTMATLLSSGVPLLEAIDVGAKTIDNAVLERSLEKCRESVAMGKGFSQPLSKISHFPKMVSQMIAIGEQTGALDAMLAKVGDFYEDELDNAIKGMMSLIEPILLVGIGGIIAFLVLAMYLPIFGMAEAATKGMG